MNNSPATATDDLNDPISPAFERRAKFAFLLALQIPSILCTGFIFYHFKWRHVQTQIYFFLLLANGLLVSVELPFTLNFLFAGIVYSINRCSGWIVLNYSLIQLSIFLMAWTSIERYLFIYHAHRIKQYFNRLHYFPIAVFHVFTPLLYTGLVFVYPCQSNYDVRFYLCGGPCYSLDRAPGFFDWFGNGITVQVITLSMNIILVARHLIRRQRMKRVIISADGRKEWRRSAKLVIQLLSVSVIYFSVYIPYMIIILILMFYNSEQLAAILSNFIVYIPYLQSLLLPFVCILYLPGIKEKFVALPIFYCCRKIQPENNRVHTRNRTFNDSATVPRH